jgi:Skp family chaperone for outer membrane proteins
MSNRGIHTLQSIQENQSVSADHLGTLTRFFKLSASAQAEFVSKNPEFAKFLASNEGEISRRFLNEKLKKEKDPETKRKKEEKKVAQDAKDKEKEDRGARRQRLFDEMFYEMKTRVHDRIMDGFHGVDMDSNAMNYVLPPVDITGDLERQFIARIERLVHISREADAFALDASLAMISEVMNSYKTLVTNGKMTETEWMKNHFELYRAAGFPYKWKTTMKYSAVIEMIARFPRLKYAGLSIKELAENKKAIMDQIRNSPDEVLFWSTFGTAKRQTQYSTFGGFKRVSQVELKLAEDMAKLSNPDLAQEIQDMDLNVED